ncbi:Alpha-ketoglutarate-dependent dioxygenase alkB homolog 4 [Anthophora plagiata]
METVRFCGCKGIRSCLLCETECNIVKPNLKTYFEKYSSYVYCPHCEKLWPGWDMDLYKSHPNHKGTAIEFPGVYIKLEFLNVHEIKTLMKALEEIPWEISQSGRRKQNFGPKCNFKKKKLQLEQCTLEYNPVRGASIDPHIDDCWIWGERIVTVNVAEYSTTCKDLNFDTNSKAKSNEDIVVRLPMPEGSLMVLYGTARYKWEHCILREDIKSRRICLAYRELTPPYLKNSSNNEEVRELLKRASVFQ